MKIAGDYHPLMDLIIFCGACQEKGMRMQQGEC